MIIPPDPEKDPNVFSASSSTPSLVSLPSEGTTDLVSPPRAVTRNSAFGYPFGGSADDLGLGYNGEALPPYRRAENVGGVDAPVDQMRQINRNRPTIVTSGFQLSNNDDPVILPSATEDELTPRASASTSRLPFTLHETQSSTMVDSSTKLWEGSNSDGRSRKKVFPAMTPGWKRWWKRWRKWVYIGIGLLLAGLGLMVGLLIGLRAGDGDQSPQATSPPWKDTTGDGKRQTWVTSGESLNITYVPSRDGPFPPDGIITSCPAFLPLNASSPLNLLARPFPAVSSSVARFEFPMWKNGTASQVLPDFTFIARGLGSSGTIELIGTDSPPEVLQDGKEGMVVIEVVALYGGVQDLDSIIRVCQLTTSTSGVGLGIFETDGKVSNAYMLNPTSLPSFHVVVHLPPSSVAETNAPSVSIPRMEFQLDRMAVRFGNMQNVAEFGYVNVTSFRGGVDAVYVSAEKVDIRTGENAVRGRWNITESIVVNNTQGSILAEVIIHDPNSTETHTTSPSPSQNYAKRGTFGRIFGDMLAPQRKVETVFMTAEGVLAVAYLYQPPNLDLSALFVNSQGDTQINIHPNYVGPFVVKNVWGQVRVPPPKPMYSMDPQGYGRKRATTFGEIDIPGDGIYGANGLNATVLQDSLVALSGAAYWQGNETMTPLQVQGLDEAGGQVLVMGAWGDVSVTFDEVQGGTM